MTLLSSHPFGLSGTELALLAAGAAYVISLARDWRPVKALRKENHDLREILKKAEEKIATLDAQVAVLEKATDLTSLLEEHKKIADVLDRVVGKLESLDQAVQAKTAAIEAIARWAALKQNLDAIEGKT